MNVDVPGQELGLYAPVDGVQTLVAARRGLELTETADTYDATHADNMAVAGAITAVDATNDTFTVDKLSTKELERAGRGTIEKSTGNDGDYTWDASGVTDNGDGTHTVDVTTGQTSDSIDDSTADGRLLVPAPEGFREFKYGFEDWEISLGAVLLLDEQTGDMEASHRALIDAKRHGTIIKVVLRYPNQDGTSDPREEGDAFVTDLTLTSGYDEMAEVDLTLQGDGKLEKVTS